MIPSPRHIFNGFVIDIESTRDRSATKNYITNKCAWMQTTYTFHEKFWVSLLLLLFERFRFYAGASTNPTIQHNTFSISYDSVCRAPCTAAV